MMWRKAFRMKALMEQVLQPGRSLNPSDDEAEGD
jgi:hypothetical protein